MFTLLYQMTRSSGSRERNLYIFWPAVNVTGFKETGESAVT